MLIGLAVISVILLYLCIWALQGLTKAPHPNPLPEGEGIGRLGTSTPCWARADPLGHPLRNHDNSGMGIGPRHMGQDGAIHHPQSLDAMHATVLIHHSHRVCGWPHL